MRTFLKKSILVLSIPLLTSCGLVNAELFLPEKLDVGSSEPPNLPVVPPPALVSKQDSWGYGGTPYDLALSGNILLAGTSRGLSIMDVSDPYLPTEINLLKGSSINRVTKVNDLLFVSSSSGALSLYNIATPQSPLFQSSLMLSFPHRVATQGTVAYVPDNASGIRVVDFSDPANLQLVTTVDTNGNAVSAQIEGSYLYVADDFQGLKIFDISTPTAPTLVGTYLTSDDALDVKVKGNYAYIAVSWSSIDIVDISNKANPVLALSYMDFFNYYNGVEKVEIQGNYLLAMDYYNGLIVYDITNPVNPITTGSAIPFATRWWGEPYGFVTNSTHMFIASETYGVGTLDISDITAPHIPYSYRGVNWWTNSVDASGNRAYVCENDWSRLTVLDISTPAHPRFLGQTPQGVTACSREIIYDNNYVYATAGNGGMKVISVSDPANPTVVATLDNGSGARKIVKQGNFVYVVYDSWLYIYNVTTPTAPTVAGSYGFYADDVHVEGNYAYLAGTSTLRIVNISNPASVTLVSNYDYPSGPIPTYSITKTGNHLFVGGNETLGVFDVSNPAAPTLVYKTINTDVPENIVIADNKLYSCIYDIGLQIFDITTPTLPVLTEVYPMGGCLGIQAKDGNIYLADESTGFKIFNDASKKYLKLNKPYTIMSLSSLSTSATKTYLADSFFGMMVLDNTDPLKPEYLTRIELYSIVAPPIEDGTTLYVADQFVLKAYNMTDPKNPVVLSQAARLAPGYLSSIEKYGSTIYAVESNTHLSIYDASNPASLTPLSTTAYASIMNLHVSGSKLLAPSSSVGLRVFDISTPATPALLGTYNSPGTAYHVIQDGSLAYLADGASGLQVVDMSNPAAPVAIGNYNTPGTAQQVAKKDNFVFVADAGHVEIVDVSTPTAPVLKRTLNKSEFGNQNARGVSIRGNYLYIQLYNGYEVFDISDIDNIHQ